MEKYDGPSNRDLFKPTLDALKQLGGSGGIYEIKKNEQIVLSALSKTKPKSIRDLVQKEYLLTPKEKINPIIEEGYLLWDGGMILLHFNEFLEQGIIEIVQKKSLLDDTYILIE